MSKNKPATMSLPEAASHHKEDCRDWTHLAEMARKAADKIENSRRQA